MIFTLMEWLATVLSLWAFYLCIRHKAYCFLVFLAGDLLWLFTALHAWHASLIGQQVLYVAMNIYGWQAWRREDQAVRQALAARTGQG